MVALEESGVDRNDEPTVERSRARSSRRIVRDVSTSLDMTKGSTERGSDTVAGSFSAVFVIPSEVEESLTISGNPHDNNFRRDGKRRRRCCRPSFSVLSGVASSEASRMGLGISNF